MVVTWIRLRIVLLRIVSFLVHSNCSSILKTRSMLANFDRISFWGWDRQNLFAWLSGLRSVWPFTPNPGGLGWSHLSFLDFSSTCNWRKLAPFPFVIFSTVKFPTSAGIFSNCPKCKMAARLLLAGWSAQLYCVSLLPLVCTDTQRTEQTITFSVSSQVLSQCEQTCRNGQIL